MNRFFLYLGIAYFSLNGWILWWFRRTLKGSGKTGGVVCLSLFALMAFFPIYYRNGGSSQLEIIALQAGCFWIGSFIYIFFMTLLVDLFDLLRRLFGDKTAAKPSRPGYRQAFGVLALTFCIGAAGWVNASFPILNEVRLEIGTTEDDPPAPVTIAAFADLHLGRVNSIARLSRAVALVLPHRPDAVFFLGDILDDHIAVDEDGLQRELERLSPPLGIWGILGNHEYIAGPVETSIGILERNGIRLLRDEWTVLEDSADRKILLAGRDDYSITRFGGNPRKSLEDILKDVPDEQRRLPLVVLDHQPWNLEEAENAGAALQLSGHTHNGQLWPFNLVVAKIYENARGLSVRGDTNYIVSVGTGTWGPPLRNNARPEVLLVRLEFVKR